MSIKNASPTSTVSSGASPTSDSTTTVHQNSAALTTCENGADTSSANKEHPNLMVNGHGNLRPAHMDPPGAKMVPVKLVSVSAEGNVRLVRVSPVKATSPTTTTTTSSGSSSVAPARTVVIKSP